MRRIWLLFCCVIIFIHPGVHADTKIIPIDTFDKLFKTLDKIPSKDRTQLDIHAIAACEGLSASDMIFEHITDSGNQTLILDPEKGYLDVEKMRALPKDAKLKVTDQDGCGFSMTMTPRIELTQSMDAKLIRSSLVQLRKAILKIVPFYARPMVPRNLELGVVLEDGDQCELVLKSGEVEMLERVDLNGLGEGIVVSTNSLKSADRLACSGKPTMLVDMVRGMRR